MPLDRMPEVTPLWRSWQLLFLRPPNRQCGSPKKDSYVLEAQESSIPAKTKATTNWLVKVWEDWAHTRNWKPLPGEATFSTMFTDLTVAEMIYLLSKYVLEIPKKNGQRYPPY